MGTLADASYLRPTTVASAQRKSDAQRSLFRDSEGLLHGSGNSVDAEKSDDEGSDSINADDGSHDSNDSDFQHSDLNASYDSDASTQRSHAQPFSHKRKRVDVDRAAKKWAASCTCKLCGESFTTQEQYTAHTQQPHAFECDIEGCGRRFADEALAIRHVTAWHQVRDHERYACEPCNVLFLTRHDLELHRQQLGCWAGSAFPKRFVCDVVPTCRRVYKKKDKLVHHVKRYHKARPDSEAFECDRCADLFSTRHERLLHCQAAHPHQVGEPKSPSFLCKVVGCGRSYSKREHLTRHVRATHAAAPQEKPFGCQLCGVRFVYKHGLTRHVANCHSNDAQKPYACSVCLLAFKKKSLLQAHSYVHTGVLPFACSDCGERFLKKFQLARHERSHAAHKPSQAQVFLCDEDSCDELFFSNKEKAEHVQQIHRHGVREHDADDAADAESNQCKKKKYKAEETSRRPSLACSGRTLRCLVCAREFERAQNLRSHLRTHFEAVDERKQHVCPMEGCGKAYTKKSNVMAHYNAVHDPIKSKRFKCPHEHCDGAFGYQTVLTNHIASVHTRHLHRENDDKEQCTKHDEREEEEQNTPQRKRQRRGRASMSAFTRLLGLNQVGKAVENMATHDQESQNTVDVCFQDPV